MAIAAVAKVEQEPVLELKGIFFLHSRPGGNNSKNSNCHIKHTLADYASSLLSSGPDLSTRLCLCGMGEKRRQKEARPGMCWAEVGRTQMGQGDNLQTPTTPHAKIEALRKDIHQ